MTALEKYIEDHPGVISGRGVAYPVSCPSNYGYLDDPIWCDFADGRDCGRCWNREIPKNKEKENENMSDILTKEELLEKKEQLDSEREKLCKQIVQAQRNEKNDKAAEELKAIYDSYVRAGFTSEQAFNLLTTMIQMSGGKR